MLHRCKRDRSFLHIGRIIKMFSRYKLLTKSLYMVKNFNELKDIAKKLMLENNYDIKEEELIYVTTTDITDYYEKIASRDKTVLSEVYGTDELPLIHNYITRAEASTKKLEMDRMIIKRIYYLE